MRYILFLTIWVGLYSTAFPQNNKNAFEISYAKCRLKMNDSAWGKWVNSYDARNKAIVNQDNQSIILNYEGTVMRFTIMDTRIPEDKKTQVIWVCHVEDDIKVWCGVIWDFSNKQNTVTLTDNSMQICYYVK